jgi:hypothetical protein
MTPLLLRLLLSSGPIKPRSTQHEPHHVTTHVHTSHLSQLKVEATILVGPAVDYDATVTFKRKFARAVFDRFGSETLESADYKVRTWLAASRQNLSFAACLHIHLPLGHRTPCSSARTCGHHA